MLVLPGLMMVVVMVVVVVVVVVVLNRSVINKKNLTRRLMRKTAEEEACGIFSRLNAIRTRECWSEIFFFQPRQLWHSACSR